MISPMNMRKTPDPGKQDREILSVSALNSRVRQNLEREFPTIRVEGEISNLARPASGHLYLTLKDAGAQVRCAMFRNRNRLLGFAPENGQQVLVRGRLSLYEPRGDYQLILEHMEEAGDGALRRAYEQLRQRLAAEGLFAEEHKIPLPALPKRIGVITSPSGAAIRDVLSILKRRFPTIPVLVYPVPVQGQGAGEEIARMIDIAAEREDCDVLILTRGGGSLEDLWAFNEEIVARAIFNCAIPIVSAVGHEIDVTIADFVADLRAPTPSGAAEMVTPDSQEWLQWLGTVETRLAQQTRRHLAQATQQLDWLGKRLAGQHPGARLSQKMQGLDHLDMRLQGAMHQRLRSHAGTLRETQARLHQHNPQQRILRYQGRFEHLAHQLTLLTKQQLTNRSRQLGALGRTLNTVSPLATLDRGYSITRDSRGHILRRAAEIEPGTSVETQLAEGKIISTVTASHSS